ncbi:MAG: flagellar biosynthesis protein FlgN [Treponemataceae bacterium]|nr:flagellar biosynthesis protein FlgN [Treponemataceae bacterium]
MENLTQEQINERVAILKRFKKLLEQQRAKFQEYLTVLEKQAEGIENEDDNAIIAHAELEAQIVQNIQNLQKVINPIEGMYKQIGCPISAEIPQLKHELSKLQDEVLVQNEKNRDLLKLHMTEIKEKMERMNDPRFNPYAKRKNVYSHILHTATVFDIQG